MSLAICTISTQQRGAALGAVRCILRKGQSNWSAGRATEPLERITTAARWIAEQVRPAANTTAPKLIVCLDTDDASCGWLSASSADDKSIKSTVRSLQGGEDDNEAATGASPTWLKSGTLDEDFAVQALTAPVPPVASKLGKKAIVGPPQRLAVLAVPDLAARLLCDQLDQIDVPVAKIFTLWHAIAGVWHNGGSATPQSSTASALQPLAATIILDPSGRLLWTWQRDGQLLAAGSIKLATRSLLEPLAAANGQGSPEPMHNASGLTDLATGASSNESNAPVDTAVELEVSQPDLGRLAADWLAWATQLGTAPSLIALVGPDSVIGPSPADAHDDPNFTPVHGLASVGSMLTKLWPGAPVQAVVNDDPITATLLAQLDADEPSGTSLPDPRKESVELSQRPSRNSRRVYQWTAGAIAAGGVVVAAAGYKLAANIAATQRATLAQLDERVVLIEKVKSIAPITGKPADVQAFLRKRYDELVKERNSLVPEKPILPEIARLLEGLSMVKGLEITRLGISSNVGSVILKAPDAETAGSVGPKIMELKPVLADFVNWSGTSSISAGNVTLNLKGMWENRQSVAKGTAPAKPSPAGDKRTADGKAAAKADDKDAASGVGKTETKPDGQTKPPVKPAAAKPDPASGNLPPATDKKPATKPIAPPPDGTLAPVNPPPGDDQPEGPTKRPTPGEPPKEVPKAPPAFSPAQSPMKPKVDERPESKPGKTPTRPVEPKTEPS